MEVLGAVASSFALVEVVIKGTSAIKKLKDRLDEAPEELDRLERIMKRLHGTLIQLRSIGINKDDEAILADSLGLAERWYQHIREIEEDIHALTGIMNKLGQAFDAPSLTSKSVRARFKKLLSDHDLQRYEQRLSSHHTTFGFMLNLVTA